MLLFVMLHVCLHLYLQMTAEGESKLLTELRVTELKSELDKRGLDKNGIKIILTDRLEKVRFSKRFYPKRNEIIH